MRARQAERIDLGDHVAAHAVGAHQLVDPVLAHERVGAPRSACSPALRVLGGRLRAPVSSARAADVQLCPLRRRSLAGLNTLRGRNVGPSSGFVLEAVASRLARSTRASPRRLRPGRAGTPCTAPRRNRGSKHRLLAHSSPNLRLRCSSPIIPARVAEGQGVLPISRFRATRTADARDLCHGCDAAARSL